MTTREMRVYDLLKDSGPMTTPQIAVALNEPHSGVSGAISRLQARRAVQRKGRALGQRGPCWKWMLTPTAKRPECLHARSHGGTIEKHISESPATIEAKLAAIVRLKKWQDWQRTYGGEA